MTSVGQEGGGVSMAAINIAVSYRNYFKDRLFKSIRGGEDVGTVRTLLHKGVDIDTRDRKGYTPLLVACEHRRKKIAELLIESGANVNLKRKSDAYTVLYHASENGWIDMVRHLVKKVPDMNTKCGVYGETSLHIASQRGHLEIVKCLVEEGAADINASTEHHGDTALQRATRYAHLDTVKYLVDVGADIHRMNLCGGTALHVASALGHLVIVKYLVEKGGDIDGENFKGDTSVLLASRHSNKDVVDLLMHSGANVTNAIGWTVLHYASQNGWLEIVKSIVKQNCDLDAKTYHGKTALGCACTSKNTDIARYLLQSGARWDIVDKGTRGSPLDYVIRKDPEFLKLFIENGVYLKRVDYKAIVNNSSLNVLQDVKLCCQAVINEFNNRDLPKFYKLTASRSLPRVEEMKMASGSEVARTIERAVEFEIKTKGRCNILQVRPMVLSVLSVRYVLEYCEKRKSELQNRLPTAFDPRNKYKRSSRVKRFS